MHPGERPVPDLCVCASGQAEAPNLPAGEGSRVFSLYAEGELEGPTKCSWNARALCVEGLRTSSCAGGCI